MKLRSIADIVPDARNANKGTERGLGLLDQSLRRYGAGRSILVDRQGRVIAGNKTVERAAEIGLPIEVVRTDGDRLVVVQREDLLLEDAPARELALADNRIAEVDLAWDAEALRQIQADGADLTQLWLPDELVAVLGADATSEGLTGPDSVPDERPTTIQRGDLFTLGDHRLLCGDSTSAGDVVRVMGDAQAVLMNTDPPYGIRLDLTETHKASNAAKVIAKQYRQFAPLQNDWLSGAELQAFLEAVIRTAVPHLSPLVAFYLWHPMLTQGTFFAAAAADILIHRQIIWVKPHFVFGRGDYHWRHELCFYGWRQGHRPRFRGPRNQNTVWDLDDGGGGSIRRDQGHPTQKPVELFLRPIHNHCIPGEIVYEPFAGSGSQLIAAEQAGVACRAIEIEPRYVQVAIDRWEAFTGRTAEKVGEIPHERRKPHGRGRRPSA